MKAVTTFFIMLACAYGFCQDAGKFVKEGNKQFKNNKFADAEANYRRAHSKNPSSPDAYYNLGNSIYRQGNGSEAKYAYAKAIDVAKSKKEKHRAYHNLGNVYLKEQDYQAAVEAYKNALRNNPHDEETRYNYALAKKKQEDSPPPPPPLETKDKDKNQDRRQSDNNQKNDSPEGKGNNRDTSGNTGDREQKQERQGDNSEGRSGMGNRDEMPASEQPSEQKIKMILDAINNEEKKVMDRINSKNSKGDPVKEEKDW